jgi:hypothetical protein
VLITPAQQQGRQAGQEDEEFRHLKISGQVTGTSEVPVT